MWQKRGRLSTGEDSGLHRHFSKESRASGYIKAEKAYIVLGQFCSQVLSHLHGCTLAGSPAIEMVMHSVFWEVKHKCTEGPLCYASDVAKARLCNLLNELKTINLPISKQNR